MKLQQVFVPPPPGWRGSTGAEASGGGGGGSSAAAAGGGGAPPVVIDDKDELDNPCPICLDNEDDATVDGKHAGMCSACGQSYCGACKAGGLADRSPNCPTCRAPIIVSEEKEFKRWWKLVHDRSPGRHTPVAQNNLGYMYAKGKGVEQDHDEAAKWFRKSAEAGHAKGQCSLGIMYYDGKGVEQDWSKAVRWFQLAGAQGFKVALTVLDAMQQDNLIPTPLLGTAVTTILLTSAKAAKYNNRTGRAVAPTEGAVITPGRAAVLLDGEAAPISFKLKNLQLYP